MERKMKLKIPRIKIPKWFGLDEIGVLILGNICLYVALLLPPFWTSLNSGDFSKFVWLIFHPIMLFPYSITFLSIWFCAEILLEMKKK